MIVYVKRAIQTVHDLGKELRVEFGKNPNINKLKLPTNRDIGFLASNEDQYSNENLVFDIFFPISKRVVPLKLCNVLPEFSKLFQMSILSHVTYCLQQRGLTHIKFPKCLVKGGTLIGSHPYSKLVRGNPTVSNDDIRIKGPLMPDQDFHIQPLDAMRKLAEIESNPQNRLNHLFF